MSGLDHVDNYPEIPVSLAPTSTVLKTGAWRSVRPVIKTRTAPCSAYCPAGISIPEYFDYLTQDKTEEAYGVFMERNPFPRITGRVCPHFCEQGCNLAVATDEEPLSIRSIERWLGDRTAEHPHSYPTAETGKQGLYKLFEGDNGGNLISRYSIDGDTADIAYHNRFPGHDRHPMHQDLTKLFPTPR